MTEAEWLTEDDFAYLLDFFEEKASRRKLRLFTVGCVRSILHLLSDPNYRAAVDVAEAFADGRSTLDALRTMHHAFEIEMNTAWRNAACVERGGMVFFARRQDALASDLPGVAQAITKEEFNEVSAIDTLDAIASVLAHSAISPNQWGTSAGDDDAMRAVQAEQPKQLHLFREVFRNPFRPVSLQRDWLAWNAGTVVKIAEAVYEERAWDRLPVLADALQEAGCENAEMLNHCREVNQHIRGCWLLDLLLGKE